MSKRFGPSIFADPETLKEMIDKYQAGVSTVELGNIYGMDHSAIFYWLRKCSVPTRPKGSPRLRGKGKRSSVFNDPAVLRTMIDEYKNGVPFVAIAAKYKMSRPALQFWLNKNGVPKRDPKAVIRINKFGFQATMDIDPRDRMCPGKNYAEYLADAIKRGDQTIKAVVGNHSLTGYI
jgi:hypothetical protein